MHQVRGISIIIPCYNEAPQVLGKTVSQVRESLQNVNRMESEILIVNDGSGKYSYQGLEIPGARIVNHKVNRGYGGALKTGILESQYDWIGITDADGTYPNERFHELINEARNYEMVVGAR